MLAVSSVEFITCNAEIKNEMKPIPRRKFIRGTALAGGAMLFLPGIQGCRFAGGSSSGNY